MPTEEPRHTHTHTHNLKAIHMELALSLLLTEQLRFRQMAQFLIMHTNLLRIITNVFNCKGKHIILATCNFSCLCSVYADNHRICISLYVMSCMTSTVVVAFRGNVYLWPFYWVTITCRSSLLEVYPSDRRRLLSIMLVCGRRIEQ